MPLVLRNKLVLPILAALAALAVFPAAVVAQEMPQPSVAVPVSQEQIRLSYAPLVRQAAPAVVNVYTRRVLQTQRRTLFSDPFFRRFFGGNRELRGAPRERVVNSLGSGVIVRPDGVIVTNSHVIAEADEITIVLTDRREFEAEILLNDEHTDLAILRIRAEGESFPYLEFTDSDALAVGDIVLAIGNPFGVGQTVTSGIISALARTQLGISDYRFFIQTDAAINPGNSGGALLGLDGRLTGINTAIYSRSGGSHGIGFAIPANMVRAVVDGALRDGGRVIRPWFGATGQAVSAELARSLDLERPMGVLLNAVYPGGPADRIGLRAGDVILSISGQEVYDVEALRYYMATKPVGGLVAVTYLRTGRRLSAQLVLEEPPETPASDITELTNAHPFRGATIANLSPALALERSLDPLAQGIVVVEVVRRSYASRWLRVGDVLVTLNDRDLEMVTDLLQIVDGDGDGWRGKIRRAGKLRDFAFGP